MKGITIAILFSASVLFIACGGRSASSPDNDVNPRDTVNVPEDLDMMEKNDTRTPSDSIVTDRVNMLKTTFARWLKARQDLAAALPKEQGDSYDYLTADMHSRMTGKLEAIIPYDYY